MRRALTACGLAAALSTLTAASAANPTLPRGWIPGGGKLADPPKRPEIGGFQWAHEATFPVRRPFPGGPFDVTALPLVEVDRGAVPEAPPRDLPEGPQGDVVVIKRAGTRRVSVQGFEAGFVQVGKAIPLGVGRQSEGGASRVCGQGELHGVVPLRYEAIRRVDAQGTIELVWARGFLDTATCGVAILERHTARPRHVAGGVLYAFRTHCATCAEGSRDLLHVLTPELGDVSQTDVPFEHRTFALGPGRSAAFEGTSESKATSGSGSWGMPDWGNLIDRQCKGPDRFTIIFCVKRVRLEVSQGQGETAPTLFVGGHF